MSFYQVLLEGSRSSVATALKKGPTANMLQKANKFSKIAHTCTV